MALLRRKEALSYTTVVAAAEGATLGERYATIAAAAALGERTRDQGGHALVVIDDLACMVRSRILQPDPHKALRCSSLLPLDVPEQPCGRAMSKVALQRLPRTDTVCAGDAAFCEVPSDAVDALTSWGCLLRCRLRCGSASRPAWLRWGTEQWARAAAGARPRSRAWARSSWWSTKACLWPPLQPRGGGGVSLCKYVGFGIVFRAGL